MSPCSLDTGLMLLRDEKIDEEALLLRTLSTPDRTQAHTVTGFEVSAQSAEATRRSSWRPGVQPAGR